MTEKCKLCQKSISNYKVFAEQESGEQKFLMSLCKKCWLNKLDKVDRVFAIVDREEEDCKEEMNVFKKYRGGSK